MWEGSFALWGGGEVGGLRCRVLAQSALLGMQGRFWRWLARPDPMPLRVWQLAKSPQKFALTLSQQAV